MKVLHVIPSVGPVRGGPSVAVLGMCRALLERGVHCDLVCTNDNGAEDLKVPTAQWVEHEGVRARFFQKKHWPIRALDEFQAGSGFSRWLRTHGKDYDLFHVHALFSYMPSCAMRFARRSGIPYVLRPLGILEEYSLARASFKKKLYSFLMDGANVKSASALHLTSRREQAVSSLPAGVPQWIIPLGVSKHGPAHENKTSGQILFLSRWHAKKRIPLLLEALGLMKDLPWELVLAGDGDQEIHAEIHKRIRSLGLSDRVVTPGFLNGDQKWSALGTASLFVLPSASENFGIAVAEAMAAGVPVVVTRQVALSEDVEKSGGGWVSGDSAEALAACMREALTCDAGRLRRGRLASGYARKHWSWDACAGALFENYNNLTGRREVLP